MSAGPPIMRHGRRDMGQRSPKRPVANIKTVTTTATAS